MQEIELKFQIPQGTLAAVKAELATLTGGQAPAQKLQAAYFDTADRKLAKARAALRVRQEDDDWVQTLKAAGPNAMTRLEDNQASQAFAPGEAIHPDLSLHQPEAVRQALMRDLGWQPERDPKGEHLGLIQLYRTDMQRLRAQASHTNAAPQRAGRVEIALDLGLIAAGDKSVPVHELEIELIDGHAHAVLDVARGLITRHGLWLDSQTKAHRGDQLAREASTGQPSPRPPVRPCTCLPQGATPAHAWVAALDAALTHISDNLSEVALETSDARADLSPWIKAWASGLRRLAWVWRHAPVGLLGPAQAASIADQIAALYVKVRPAAGRYIVSAQAIPLARSAAPTLLALDVLDVIVAAG
ncbi:MAG: CYTH domain-containing protein [Aquabacterium sp.]|uniref:CYTH domain-containing protein n=1 Tax=Aquabacterium sp. TaxID=1872578 RepID=UPI0025C035E7|nr:CYTH domain-containing protein [Aquabacterium sp.]MBI5926311.1 CYTH domain-containing protein [Aquabacterium sp.]